MGDLPVGTLGDPALVLLLLSAFFSGTETALMSVNRYRLRHLAREGSSVRAHWPRSCSSGPTG